jgi:serine/threonine-protein kinase
VVFGTVGMAAIGRSFGPLVLVPSLLAVNAAGFMLAPRRLVRWLSLAITSSAVLVPLLLEWLGVLSPSYLFEGGRMVIVPHLNDLPAVPSLVVVATISVGIIINSALFLSRVRATLNQAEERLHLNAWQLRQLVPAGTSVPPAAGA